MSHGKPWLWHCPHCDIGGIPLRAIWRHVNHHHNECLSCQAEVLLAAIMMRGGTYWVDGKRVPETTD